MTLLEPAREQMSQEEVIGKLGRQRRQEKRGSRRRPPGAGPRKPERIWLKCVINCRGPGVGYRKRMSPGAADVWRAAPSSINPTECPKGSSVTFLRKCPPGFGQPLLKSA